MSEEIKKISGDEFHNYGYFVLKWSFQNMLISETFYFHENAWRRILKLKKNLLNFSCQKAWLKTVANAQFNRFGPAQVSKIKRNNKWQLVAAYPRSSCSSTVSICIKMRQVEWYVCLWSIKLTFGTDKYITSGVGCSLSKLLYLCYK